MLLNHAYYAVKPLLPSRFRLALRRLRGQAILKKCGSFWPISEKNGRAPKDWPGWPDGKQFAFVLTHDVEGLRGLNRCRQVAEIEMEYGFRSSFNFIPKGEYEVPTELITWLRENGFEVGVHDLRHDGALFQSRERFKKDSAAINEQLKSWGAVGFRAGFMLHKLDWLHDLNIEYDSSTFDVDPFEPQPDGTQTIFPFWVPKPDPEADAFPGKPTEATKTPGCSLLAPNSPDEGYIELSYTLVQDYNLFIVLQQKGIDIWKKKLSWLAAKGGMAMLDTHPDYMATPGDTANAFEYPVQFYRDFLHHIQTEYAGQYWAALPRDVAAYSRPLRPKQARPPRHVVMATHSYYKFDNRVRRYAETLVRRGDHVKVLSLGDEAQVNSRQWETLNGVEILFLQSKPGREVGKWNQALCLALFFYRVFAQLSPKKLPQGCDLLHVHNIPDFLVFAGVRLKHRGTAIILDIHDIVPELYESKYASGGNSIFVVGLRRIEKWSCRFAHHVIIANHIWKKTLTARALPAPRLTALINNVDLDLFSRKARTRTDDRIVLLYPGSLNTHQGLDIAINAMATLCREFPKIELHIYGRGPALPSLQELAQKLGLTAHVKFASSIKLEEVSTLMANADIGIVPKRASGFGDQAYSTKIMEFMSQGLPVVISRTRIDSLYFDDSVAAFFESGNPDDLVRAVRSILTDSAYRQQLSERGYAYAQANSWETMKDVYLDVVDRLTMTSISRP